ncbi:MAG: hypothetical protein II980_04300 [Clostridia bacterium]|nr:hypothetical protein [Clostridia bacterium]
MAKDKKTKKKITYVDDGRTIADMSAVGGKKASEKKQGSNLKSQWQTYKDTVKMMFVPMLIVLGIIAVAFGIVYLLF